MPKKIPCKLTVCGTGGADPVHCAHTAAVAEVCFDFYSRNTEVCGVHKAAWAMCGRGSLARVVDGNFAVQSQFVSGIPFLTGGVVFGHNYIVDAELQLISRRWFKNVSQGWTWRQRLPGLL